MQQQTNFFTPTQKHLIQLHGFPNITDIIYVKPLYSVRSLVVYPSLRPDSVAIPLFHSAEGQRYLSPQYYLLFATYHMYDRLFIYVKHTNSYVPSRIPVPTTAKNESCSDGFNVGITPVPMGSIGIFILFPLFFPFFLSKKRIYS